MNVVKVYGGLGNQMFQYAFGKAMMARGRDVRFDLSYFDRPQVFPRPYGLDKFYTTNIKLGELGKGKEVNEVKLQYKKDVGYLDMDGCDFYGYWQHPAYFRDILPTLRQEFRLRKDLYTDEYLALRERIIVGGNAVSLHVRRGDLVQLNGHYLLAMEYYRNALSYFPLHDVCVFSDDLPWCKDNFPGVFTYVGLDEWSCFDLMRVCKDNIIANSTYSWWAAYLGTNPDKVVIAPKRWRKNPNDPAWTDMDFKRPAVNWKQIDAPGMVT